MNPRRFTTVAPAFCGTVVLAGVIVGWLAGFGSAGTENTGAVPIEDRAASLAANARLADEPQAIAMGNAVVANTAVATPLSLAPKWRRPPNPRRGRPPTRRRPRISRNRSSWPRCPIRRRRCRPIYRLCRIGGLGPPMSPNRCRQRAMPPTAPVTQDFRYLIYYVWSELPPAEKPADIVLRSLKDTPVGTPVEEIKRASDAFGLDFNFMKAVAKIESGFDPKQRTGSYIGLFQLSKYEFNKFGSGQILNPRDNAVAAAYKVITEGILFEWVTQKKPTLSDLYLIHQQGWEGAAEHISQPDRIAWKSMCATSEGREKGEKWCKRAIWRNTLPAVKARVEIGG